jgi:hypothetical protein
VSTTISSRWTPFYKFVTPIFVIVGVSAGAYAAWLHPERQHANSGIPPEYTWMVFLAIGAVASLVMFRLLANLKHVELDGDDLIISNYREEIRVPLANVEKISGRSLSNPPRYRVTFIEPTEFGRTVSFIAPQRFSFTARFTEPDEIVELRSAWETARAAAVRR